MAKLMKQPWLWLALLVIFALFIRVFRLGITPRGLLIDELHYGYIAESLLQTGRDEHGVRYPLVFKGFGDQKLPVYAYALMPAVRWLGLSALAIRLPSALAGTLLVVVSYLLLREMKLTSGQALWGAAVTAVSPWSFFLSRFAFESNVALLLFAFGLFCLLKAARSPRWIWWVPGIVSWALTWYTYVAYRPVTLGLLTLWLGFLVVKRQLALKSAVAIGVIFLATVAPLFHPAVVRSGTARLTQVGIFTDPGVVLEINENRTFCTAEWPRFLCYAFWNKPVVMARELLQRFVDIYSPQFLVTQGENNLVYLSVEQLGQFYLVLYPLLLLGLMAVLFRIEGVALSASVRWLLILGLLIAPLPAVLSGEPQKVRLSPLFIFMLPTLVLGWRVISSFIASSQWRHWLGLSLAGFLSVAAGSFFINYFTIHTVKHDLAYLSYLPDLFARLAQRETPQTKVVIKPFFSDPIMAYAYYRRIDPALYQEQVVLGKVEGSGFQHAVGLGNYSVSEDPLINIGCRAVTAQQPTLYVTNEYFREIGYLDRIASQTGAIYYAYVYDAFGYAQAHPEQCL